MKIAITMDSACDISEEIRVAYDFKIIPFTVTLGDKSFEDGKIDTDEIFAYVAETGILPKTSAINEASFYDFFAEVRKNCDAMIHIGISSDFSSAHQNAVNAAKRLKNVYVVDSRSLSTGIALLGIYAKKLTEQYSDPKKIVELVNAAALKTQASFVIERLDYLYKGGRCSSLALFGANVLKLRPEIIVSEGKMKAHRKYKGKMPKVIAEYCRDVLHDYPDPDKSVCFITHSKADPEMIEAARAAVNAAGFETVYETVAGCTVSSHCGKNTLGILFINR